MYLNKYSTDNEILSYLYNEYKLLKEFDVIEMDRWYNQNNDCYQFDYIYKSSNTSKTVGSVSTLVADSKGSRNLLIFTNDSDETIYLSFGDPAVLNKGVRLNASGGAYEVNESNPFTGQIFAICTSGNKNLCVTEIYWS